MNMKVVSFSSLPKKKNELNNDSNGFQNTYGGREFCLLHGMHHKLSRSSTYKFFITHVARGEGRKSVLL
jgi:hypothetical protein